MPLATLAHADPYPQWGDCGSGGVPALHRVEITGGSALTTAYIDDEDWLLGNGTSFWLETNGDWVPKAPGVYLEGLSNANLQEGGSPPWIPGDSWICYDESLEGPDQVYF